MAICQSRARSCRLKLVRRSFVSSRACNPEITARPPLHLAISAATEDNLAEIAGGLSVALARTFRLVDPHLKHSTMTDWKHAFQISNLLL